MNNLITSIKENNVPLTPEQVEEVKDLVKKLAETPTPTTKTDLSFFLADIKSFEVKSKAILEFVKEEVSRLSQQHKDAVSTLKQLEEQVVLASQKDRAITFANELLAQDPKFKIEGLRKTQTYKLIYDKEELLESIVKHPRYLPYVKLQTDAHIKKHLLTVELWNEDEVLSQITNEDTQEIK